MHEPPHTAWIRTYARLLDAQLRGERVPCPRCHEAGVQHQFVGDPATRIGYAAIWCERCERGLILSRVGIPDGASMLPFGAPDAQIAAAIPDYVVAKASR